MFEDYTYEALLEDVLDNAPDDIDTRPGSIFYDAVSGILLKVAKLYTDLDLVFDLVMVNTATGEYLDAKASEYGIARLPATSCRYLFEYEGTRPDVGERFFTDGLYFILEEADDGILYLEAEEAGTSSNGIYAGTSAIPVGSIQGLTSAMFGEIYSCGTDAESDESLRERVLEKVAGPAENGNRQHYKSWCESVTGVGRVRITPLWNGENTIKAILINPDGLPVSDSVENEVQQYIDPNSLGKTVTINGRTYNIGDGLGNGVANIGAHFTAASAAPLNIDIDFSVEIAEGKTKEEVKRAVEDAVALYFKVLVMDTSDNDVIIVRINAIGAILAGLTSYIVDYRNLKLNGDTENITPDNDEVPMLREVVLNVL